MSHIICYNERKNRTVPIAAQKLEVVNMLEIITKLQKISILATQNHISISEFSLPNNKDISKQSFILSGLPVLKKGTRAYIIQLIFIIIYIYILVINDKIVE